MTVKCALTKGMSFYLSEKDCDRCIKLSKCIFIAECKLFSPGLFKTSSRSWKRPYQALSTRTVARYRVSCYWLIEISDIETSSKTFPGKSEIGRRSNFENL
jgi:hypothetical protein